MTAPGLEGSWRTSRLRVVAEATEIGAGRVQSCSCHHPLTEVYTRRMPLPDRPAPAVSVRVPAPPFVTVPSESRCPTVSPSYTGEQGA